MTSTELDPSTDLVVRPAEPGDADQVAEVYLAARRAAVPAMPPPVHPEQEVRRWVAERVGSGDQVWVAEVGGRVAAYCRLTPGWLDDLYVRPGLAGQGIGTALLELAMSLHPDGFGLWVFAANAGARRFYRRHGLLELEHTDGRGNQEQAPDVAMAWPGRDPVGYLRRQVDTVDDELVGLLDRRAALTRAIQSVKPVGGQAGRDPEREAEIVARMAARSELLDPDLLGRIMREVITAGLTAAERR